MLDASAYQEMILPELNGPVSNLLTDITLCIPTCGVVSSIVARKLMASVRDFALALEIRVKEEEVEEKEATREPVRRACADGSSSYYEATHDCAGYVYCTPGVPGQPYPCGDGMLYDQAGQRCNWSDQVSYDGFQEEEGGRIGRRGRRCRTGCHPRRRPPCCPRRSPQ